MSIRNKIVVGLLVVVLGAAVLWSLIRIEPSLASLTSDEKKMLSTWKGDPDKAKVIGAIFLKHSLSKKQITDFLGTPQYPDRGGDVKSIGYSYAPSQVLSIYFDQNDKAIHVEGGYRGRGLILAFDCV